MTPIPFAVIVGSGAGGAITAHELAASGRDVVVVEEGDDLDAGAFDQHGPKMMGAMYRRRGMTPIVGRVPIGYVEGCCVGGSSEINSGFWHRVPREVLLSWKGRYELDGASPQELEPHYEWAEAALGVGLSKRPWPGSTAALARGIAAMGWSYQEVPRAPLTRPDPRDPAQGDASGPTAGVRSTVLARARAAGARLISNCRVTHLLRRGARVDGVLARFSRADGVVELVRILGEHVFVCCGPTETPALLRRSGVKLHIGDTLRVHPMLKVAARFPEPVGGRVSPVPLIQIKEFWPEISLGGAFFSTGHLAMLLSDNWLANRDLMRHADCMASYYVAVKGTGAGMVRPSRVDPDGANLRYDLSDIDILHLSRGLARLSEVLLAAGAIEVLPCVQGLPAIRSEVEAVRWLDERLVPASLSLGTVHAFSSCPIGEREDRCAANSFGKVRGFENLYINDASMLPDSPGVNPQGAVMALARRNVVRFLEENP
ncbi:MAG: GMC family oxidoreductase [Candidatus Schekmanbacteria bacterium]|nr:GMC family oxidoreductase [Candidatus Schekmanbacteria bacterium]